MVNLILCTGRGGTGKSTFSAMVSKYLSPPLLLIDADPDQSLADMLGVDLEKEGVSTVASMVSDAKNMGGLSPRLYFDELKDSLYANCICRSQELDLLTLGTKWAEGCYCLEDNSLKGIIPRLIGEYESVVIDSPAGLEHLNRRVVSHIDDLFVLSDPSLKSTRHVERMKRVTGEVNITYDFLYLVANHEFNEEAERYLQDLGEHYFGKIDYDVNVKDYNLKGKSLWDLPEDSPACLSVKGLLRRIQQIDSDHFQLREEMLTRAC